MIFSKQKRGLTPQKIPLLVTIINLMKQKLENENSFFCCHE